ncbi:MAG: hypothetical protein KIS90_06100 [Phenylobacterium sp.]|nr:hypothetical protein [Phenylobacterium sp.]
MAYRELDSGKLIETLKSLARRIGERFPGSGLSAVAEELVRLAETTEREAARIASPNIALRLTAYAAVAGGVAGVIAIVWLVKLRMGDPEVFEVFQGVEAAINIIAVAGAIIFFAITIGDRIRRRRAMKSLHGIRSLIHVIDMHQLTKDPSVVIEPSQPTRSSPERRLTRFELVRYRDYCSEMLSLAGKLAALYAQSLPDSVVISAVNDIEELAGLFSQKIWQKIAILERNDSPGVG